MYTTTEIPRKLEEVPVMDLQNEPKKTNTEFSEEITLLVYLVQLLPESTPLQMIAVNIQKLLK